MKVKTAVGLSVVVSIMLFLLPSVFASSPPDVALYSPGTGTAYTTNDVTLSCNVTDDENLYNVSLYTNVSGVFAQSNMTRFVELESDGETLLMCHFNDTYVCEGGETGTNTSTSFVDGMFRRGVEINTSQTLTYPTSGNILYDQGTVEFWFSLGLDPGGNDAYMFTTGSGLNENEIQIYITEGGAYFVFLDDGSADKSASKDVSSLVPGEWHFLSAIWDINNLVGSGGILDLFLDGSNESVAYTSNHYGYGTVFSSSMHIGSYSDGNQQGNVTFDEFRISGVARSPSQINASYLKAVQNHTQESASWLLSNLADGYYVWNCLAYDNESQSAWNDTNFTFTVDASPPVLESVTLLPSSSNAIDPGTNINVSANVSDFSGVSAVKLQYKPPLAGTYTNDSMDYNSSSGFWVNGTIATTFSDLGNWTYRFWYNDTNGLWNYSQIYMVPVQWENSWDISITNASGEASDSFGYVTGFKGTSQKLGEVTITNTGDQTIYFDMVSTPWTVPFTYNVTEPFDLPAGTGICIVVNATMPETPNEYSVILNVNSSSSNVSSYLINGSVVSYIGGPYINETTNITSYDSVIYQSTSSNLTATVKNIGNETATNVWLNWTLPSGWANTSGNLTGNIGNLEPYGSVTRTITVYVSSSVTAGTAAIYVNSTSDEGAGGSESKTVVVSCNSDDGTCGSGCTYISDDDCPVGGGGDGTTGGTTAVTGGGPSGGYELKLIAPSRFDINRGEEGNFTVTVNYDLSFTADDVRLSVSGYPQTYMSITPLEYDGVNPGSMPSFTVRVGAPAYIKLGEYPILIRATGRGSIINAELSGSVEGMIFVSGTGNEPDLFQQAGEAAGRMIESGLSVSEMQNLLNQMETLINESDYDSAKRVAENIISTSELAFRVKSLLEQIAAGIGQSAGYGFGTPETSKLYDIAMLAFKRGDYERAEERANNALLSLSVETYGIIPMMLFIHSYWWAIIPTLVLAGLGAVGMRRVVSSRKITGMIRGLEHEERVINNLMVSLQKNYFVKKSIGKDAYIGSMEDYRSRIAGIRRLKDSLKARKLRGDPLSRLRMEKSDIIRFMKETQIKYLDRGDMGRGLYETIMKRMKEELAEVEKNMDIASKKRKGSCRLVVFPLVLLVLLAPLVAAQVTEEDAAGEISGAGQAIWEMMDAGFGTSYANDTMAEANIMLGRGEYAAAASLARDVWDIRNAAFDADVLIDKAEEGIYTAGAEGIDVSQARVMIDEGISLFDSENYVESRGNLQGAIELIEKMRAEAALEQSLGSTILGDVAAFVTEYWIFLLSGLLGAVVIAAFALRRRRTSKLKGKIRGLEEEMSSLDRMMKLAQDRYFRINSMGKLDYEISMERYRKRAVFIEKEIMALKQNPKA